VGLIVLIVLVVSVYQGMPIVLVVSVHRCGLSMLIVLVVSVHRDGAGCISASGWSDCAGYIGASGWSAIVAYSDILLALRISDFNDNREFAVFCAVQLTDCGI